VPQRVRSDQGGENTEVWLFICEVHEEPSAAVVGSSTQRTNREGVYRCVSAHYCEMFYNLESHHQLNPLNHTDIAVLPALCVFA
jgi:hypothetical protein